MSKKKNKAKQAEDVPVRIVGPDGEPMNSTPEESPKAPSDAESLAAQRDDLLARLQRLSADYQNFQKRVQKERDQERQFANEGLMKSLLPVLDDMERGLAAARENHPADDPLLAGMQLVHDKLMQTLEQFGLSAIQAEGKPFDPERHSAMMQEPNEDVEPMTILRVLQRGYELKGRTLRPAAVVVAQAPAEKPEESPQNNEEEM
ncbi:MAG: nucleotide exchange factor GrpE [Phycisphaerae bacterium]|nr:nucleotide exchange factor GrpE [Phycisphaerae bacterium]